MVFRKIKLNEITINIIIEKQVPTVNLICFPCNVFMKQERLLVDISGGDANPSTYDLLRFVTGLHLPT